MEIGLYKIEKSFQKAKKTLINTFIVLVVLALAYLVYYLLKIQTDETVVQEYQSKSKEINISFDKVFLKELSSKKAPISVQESGGRNPFLPF